MNRIPIHRLNNTEYDNTVRDLLGIDSAFGKSFIDDEKLLGFDDIAVAFGMTDAQYEQYFNAADALVDQTFADPSLRARIVTCAPASSGDASCTRSIITTFGLRAFRRPLEASEVDRLAKLASDVASQGDDFTSSIAVVVKAMLSSAAFLYRTELDPDPSSTAPHPVAPYEMASRLSYLLWSTMPDADLLAAAGRGELLTKDSLDAQVHRMLGNARSQQFIANFAGQWLGLRDLASHQVEPSLFPSFDDTLRASMIREGELYFDQFLTGGRSMREFFTADVNFVDAPLAALYGMAPPAGASPEQRMDTGDARRGFLGLAAFLTMTSYSYRTAPTLRGKWVLENLLCQDIPPPPPNVPLLDTATDSATEAENVRQRLEAHRANPTCASCHKVLDPIGLGLENFDAIGKYRTSYENGDAIDASGVLPDGTMFRGLGELTSALSGDERLTDCVSEKLLTYALSREVVDTDATYLKTIRDGWKAAGLGLTPLLLQIVESDPFRDRRGEPQ